MCLKLANHNHHLPSVLDPSSRAAMMDSERLENAGRAMTNNVDNAAALSTTGKGEQDGRAYAAPMEHENAVSYKVGGSALDFEVKASERCK